VIRSLSKNLEGHLYILIATDYFLKWAEATTLNEFKKEKIVSFIQTRYEPS
jgi:hypothetical protein